VADTHPIPRTFAPLVVSTDNDMQFEASNRQHRVFTMTVAENTVGVQAVVTLQLAAAAVQFIAAEYIAPLKQRMQALAAIVRSADGMYDLQQTACMQSVAYISPVFIPITIGAAHSSSGHAITSYTGKATKLSDCMEADERQYPHIVFHIVPYSAATAAAIAETVLCGKRADDRLTFVLQLPEGLPLHPCAKEMSLLVTAWLSSMADLKLDMYLLPDNW
jgi:hypothetical protein